MKPSEWFEIEKKIEQARTDAVTATWFAFAAVVIGLLALGLHL